MCLHLEDGDCQMPFLDHLHFGGGGGVSLKLKPPFSYGGWPGSSRNLSVSISTVLRSQGHQTFLYGC